MSAKGRSNNVFLRRFRLRQAKLLQDSALAGRDCSCDLESMTMITNRGAENRNLRRAIVRDAPRWSESKQLSSILAVELWGPSAISCCYSFGDSAGACMHELMQQPCNESEMGAWN
ncbi:hypothetical protein MGYG_08767 [Nannizzia gypsea CBS 118893]|uniref:Uncharacterized protein n=1 Tax=Arthroderma gypseum (strain ATCC MYA-4604 / CBS 118893) TaxID=535722 RepID=E4V6Y0_ARTGP|nr:hypothetical protein MGYG_08767 [Nannizzia gypsea CBS 118893]EFQ96846.1 hypothetical protein MGYG_08767 [Nannizzia gypsea CBS 118893]